MIANPGPDGISLREALQATNNDPGQYTIRFASGLAGATILVGSSGHQLPPLTGGGVTVEGDIDSDGRPDVTLRATGVAESPGVAGFQISSSGNRLQALMLEGFQIGVDIRPENFPLPTNRTFADNVVRGLTIRSPRDGILLHFYSLACGMDKPPCQTHNRWVNTSITGNTIETRQSGIHATLAFSAGDRIDGVTITDNIIRQDTRFASEIGPSIQLDLGGNATRNVISDALIARNSIKATQVGGDAGIVVAAGLQRAQANSIDRVRILDNRIHVARRRFGQYCCFGIIVGAGFDTFGVNFRPINYPDRNVVRNVQIAGNSVSGSLVGGVEIQVGHQGGSRNRVGNVRIQRNVIRSTVNWAHGGVYLWVGQSGPHPSTRAVKAATGNRITGVAIDANRITNGKGKSIPDQGLYGLYSGGIVLLGGFGDARNGVIRDVWIRRNRIAGARPGVRLIGGVAITPDTPRAATRGNSVSCVRLARNRITGARKAISVEPNLGGASNNRASLGGC